MVLHDFLTQLFAHMGIEDVQIEEKDNEEVLEVVITVPADESGILIGRRGETLDALQKVVRLVFQHDVEKPIVVNVNNFREQREEYLAALATRIATQVAETGRPYTLSLPASERRIVHMTLSENEEVQTHSEGEGIDRVLIIEPKTTESA